MSIERIDTIDRYFKIVTKLDNCSKYLLGLSVLLSVSIFYLNQYPQLKYWANIIFIIITVLYFISSNVLSLYLLRDAQSRRRTNLLANSFGIALDDERTNLYYNNQQNPSLERLGINTFENSLFTWRVTSEMAKFERVKIISYFMIWILAMLVRNTNLELISIIAQTVLTTGLVTNGVKLEILRHECKNIFEDFRNFFLTNHLPLDDTKSGFLLSLVMRYECTIASMGVHLSSDIFHRINQGTTEEWEDIKRNLNIQ